MPLTPEDVANKQFTSTRLKPGYDETEVDEFLDEVEAELTRLYRENDELRSKLAAAGSAAPVPAGAAAQPAAPAAPDPALVRENEDLKARLAAAQRQLAEAANRPAPQAQAPAPQAAPAAEQAAPQGQQPGQPAPAQGGPARSPFAPGAPVGEQAPSGPPQQPQGFGGDGEHRG